MLEKHPEKHVELLEIIQKFRDDEMDHHDTGLKMGAEQVWIFSLKKEIKWIFKTNYFKNKQKAPFYKALTQIIKAGCKGAVWVAEKIWTKCLKLFLK